MPRRDVVLTGLLAFGVGVAVGANWGKIRKKLGPVVENLGLKMADLGDFLSATGMEETFADAMQAERPSRPAARRSKAKGVPASEDFIPKATARKRAARSSEFSKVRPFPKSKAKGKTALRKSAPLVEEEVPLATGTYGR